MFAKMSVRLNVWGVWTVWSWLLPLKRLVEQVIFESLVRLARKFVNLPVVNKLVSPSILKELK